MNNGDWVRLRSGEDDAVGMVIGWRGADPVVSWDVPEQAAVTTENAADLVVAKGLYKSRRRGYDGRSGTEDPARRQGVKDGKREADHAEGTRYRR